MPLDTLPHAPNDFDFIVGDWTVKHERLRARLAGNDEWEQFDGLSSTVKTLGGFGNLEDNLLKYPSGDDRAVALRSFDTATGAWSIWWLDGRSPTSLDVPVAGTFENGIGIFHATDTLNGDPILFRFTGDSQPEAPTWEQAFSGDQGTTWETNWRMTFTSL